MCRGPLFHSSGTDKKGSVLRSHPHFACQIVPSSGGGIFPLVISIVAATSGGSCEGEWAVSHTPEQGGQQ